MKQVLTHVHSLLPLLVVEDMRLTVEDVVELLEHHSSDGEEEGKLI